MDYFEYQADLDKKMEIYEAQANKLRDMVDVLLTAKKNSKTIWDLPKNILWELAPRLERLTDKAISCELYYKSELHSNLSGKEKCRLLQQRHQLNATISTVLRWCGKPVPKIISRAVSAFNLHTYEPKVGIHKKRLVGEIDKEDGTTVYLDKMGNGIHVNWSKYDVSLDAVNSKERSKRTYEKDDMTIEEHSTCKSICQPHLSVCSGDRQCNKFGAGFRDRLHEIRNIRKTDSTPFEVRENLSCEYVTENPDPSGMAETNRTEYVHIQQTEKDYTKYFGFVKKDIKTTSNEIGFAEENAKFIHPPKKEDGLITVRCETNGVTTVFKNTVKEKIAKWEAFGIQKGTRERTYEPRKRRVEQPIAQTHCVAEISRRNDRTPLRSHTKNVSDKEQIHENIYTRADVTERTYELESDGKISLFVCEDKRTERGLQVRQKVELDKTTSYGLFNLLHTQEKVQTTVIKGLTETSDIVNGKGANAVTTNVRRYVSPTTDISYVRMQDKTGFLSDRKTETHYDKDKNKISERVEKTPSAGVCRATSTFAGNVTNLVIKDVLEGQHVTSSDLTNVTINTAQSYCVGTFAKDASVTQSCTKSLVGLSVASAAANVARTLMKDKSNRTVASVLTEAVYDIMPAAVQIVCAAKKVVRSNAICTAASVAGDAVRTAGQYLNETVTGEEAINRCAQQLFATGVGMGASSMVATTLTIAGVTSLGATLVLPAVASSLAVYGSMKLYSLAATTIARWWRRLQKNQSQIKFD